MVSSLLPGEFQPPTRKSRTEIQDKKHISYLHETNYTNEATKKFNNSTEDSYEDQ